MLSRLLRIRGSNEGLVEVNLGLGQGLKVWWCTRLLMTLSRTVNAPEVVDGLMNVDKVADPMT